MVIYLLCSQCGEHIGVPLSTLRQPYQHQDLSYNAFGPVAVACPRCMTVEVQSSLSVLQAQVADSPDLPEWHFDGVWLGCEAEDCKSPLPLVYSWIGDTHEQRVAETKRWRAKNLHCLNGHPVLLPKFFD
jgi:hypothetical protein